MSVPQQDYTFLVLVLYSWEETLEAYARAGPYTWKSTPAGECAWYAVGNTAALKKDLAEYLLQILVYYYCISYITHYCGNK